MTSSPSAVTDLPSAHFEEPDANTAVLISAAVGVLMFPLIGAAGQRFGRREVFLVIGAPSVVIPPVAFALAVSNVSTPALIVAFGCLSIVTALTVWAMIAAHLMKMLPPEVRSSRYGIAYSLPSVVPAFYSYFMLGRGDVLPCD